VPVAIDPGMGWSPFLDCVRRSRPSRQRRHRLRRTIHLARLSCAPTPAVTTTAPG
jgi:hypothetical protein